MPKFPRIFNPDGDDESSDDKDSGVGDEIGKIDSSETYNWKCPKCGTEWVIRKGAKPPRPCSVCKK